MDQRPRRISSCFAWWKPPCWTVIRRESLLAASVLLAAAGRGADMEPLPVRAVITNTAQFHALSARDYADPTPFQLQGVVTLVDASRHLMVLQDATGALALNFDWADTALQAGQLVSVAGTNCYPYVTGFSNYPYCPNGREIRPAFEAPLNWGEYHLTRMRAYLHPPITGKYTFWVASDNSSELWLGSNEDPAQARKIAFIPRYAWVRSREWFRYPSQQAENVMLTAGRTYYIEALEEQTTGGDNLAVAWQGPDMAQTVIAGSYLTPWTPAGQPSLAGTNGVLFECWTNYSAGDLSILYGVQPFEPALQVVPAKVTVLGMTHWPAARKIPLNQALPPDRKFGWVQVEGTLKFAGIDNGTGCVELFDGEDRIQVRILKCTPDFLRLLDNSQVHVEGVCEGSYDRNGVLHPDLIWVPNDGCVQVLETTGATVAVAAPTNPISAGPDPMPGFYTTHGAVTFNDRVLDEDCLFVQEDSAAVSVQLKGRNFKQSLVVGEWVELGGTLRPGRNVPALDPLVVAELGWRAMPKPILQPLQFPLPGNRDGRWMEIEGVVRSVNTNGTLSIWGKNGKIDLWLGKTPPASRCDYVDAKLRLRGVLALSKWNEPVLLVPSRAYVEVEDEAPADPFARPAYPVADLPVDASDGTLVHRAKVRGTVIYCQGSSLYLQDASGGVRVETVAPPTVQVGDRVEASGFPISAGTARVLGEALLRNVADGGPQPPKKLAFTEIVPASVKGTLVQVTATLLSQKTRGVQKLLELEEHQRIFTATLEDAGDALPRVAPGSRVRVMGVLQDGDLAAPVNAKAAAEGAGIGSLNLLMRAPADLIVLSGPPWWTWKQSAMLVGVLLTVLLVTLLWVYMLRRRLERQHAARLLFSRQILQGQESERRRIAVNLHDSLGQNLLVIKNQARMALQSAGEVDWQGRLNKISEITSQAIEEVRQITRDLRPYQLDRLGLTQAIRAVVDRASENGPVSLAASLDNVDGIFDQESEIHVYRIIQEALNNILKHSSATEAAVVIKCLDQSVTLSVRDNGRGFDTQLVETATSSDIGCGLAGMQERVRILGGRLEVNSTPGQGAVLFIEIPKPGLWS